MMESPNRRKLGPLPRFIWSSASAEDSGWRDLAGMRNRVRRMLEFKACFLSSGPIANAQAGEGIR